MSFKTVLQTLPEELEKIKKTYEINKQNTDDIKHLKVWLSKQQHLPQDIKDEFLQKFLFMNKFSLEKTKRKIDMYFSIRNIVPEFFSDRDFSSSKMQKHLETQIFTPLPNLTNDFSRVHLFTYQNTNVESFDILQHIKYLFATADVRLFYDDCVTDTYILDMKNCKMEHVMKHNPVLIKKAVTVVENAYSDRLKGLHFVNLPNYAYILVNMAKTLLNEKISQRVYVHKDLNSLHNLIPKNILPIEYGGSNKSLNEIYSQWRKILLLNNNWITEIGQKRSVEKLRNGPKISEDIFGSIHGSFRQLTVD